MRTISPESPVAEGTAGPPPEDPALRWAPAGNDPLHPCSRRGPGSSRTTARARRIAIVSGACCCAIGVVAIVAWHLHLTAVLHWVPWSGPIAYNAALGLALAGAGAVSAALPGRRMVVVAAVANGLIGSLTLLEYLTGRSFAIDTLLVDPTFVRWHGGLPGRPGVNTATCLVVTSITFAYLETDPARRRPWVVATAGSFVGAVALVTLFGYAAGVPSAYGWGRATAMSAPTAAAVVLLATSLVAIAWTSPRSSPGALPEWFPIPTGVLALGASGLIWVALLAQTTSMSPRDVANVARAATISSVFMSALVGTGALLAQQAARRRHEAEALAGSLSTEIDHRTAAQEELRRSERRLAQFLDALPVGVFIADSEGKPRYVNGEAERLLGRGIVEEATREKIALAYQAYVAATDTIYPTEKLPMSYALRGETAHVDDMEIRLPDRRIPLEVWSAPITGADGSVDFALLAFTDISERRRAQAEMAERAALLDLAHEAILVRDLNGRITYWNRGAEQMYEFSQEEAIGRFAHDLLRTELPRSDAFQMEAPEPGTWTGELRHHNREGQALCVESRWAAYHGLDGQLRGYLEVNRDVTARKLAQQQLAERAKELERANTELARTNTELERANTELETFAYAASHDLSEPLRAISGPMSRLAHRYRGQLDDDADRLISFAVNGCARMQELIDDLLSYSRVGRSEKPMGPVDLRVVVTGVLENLSSTLDQTGGSVSVVPMPEMFGEANLLREVFQNLISNALKFHHPGTKPLVDIGAALEGDAWRFTVTDIHPQFRPDCLSAVRPAA